jgi:hypothetical protein
MKIWLKMAGESGLQANKIEFFTMGFYGAGILADSPVDENIHACHNRKCLNRI